MIQALENLDPDTIRVREVLILTKSRGVHPCCNCGKELAKRKLKASIAAGGRGWNLYICKNCFWEKDHELRPAIIQWREEGGRIWNTVGRLTGKKRSE